MANSAPMIGETGLDFAVDLVNAGYRDGHNVKVCTIGDSTWGDMVSHIMRLGKVPCFRGIDVTRADSVPGISFEHSMCPAAANGVQSHTVYMPGAAGGAISPQLYHVDGAVEFVFNANAIPAPDPADPEDLSDNRLIKFTPADIAANKESSAKPSFEDAFCLGDWFRAQVDAGGNLIFRVWFLNNAAGVGVGDGGGETNRIFLHAFYDATNANIVRGDPFTCYAASNTIVSQSLTLSAASIGALGPISVELTVRVVDGDAIGAGKNCIVLGAELYREEAKGLQWMDISRGGYGTASDGDGYANTDKYSAVAWERLGVSGVTHVVIALAINPDGADGHPTELRNIISRIRAYAPNCKFCFLSPYDLNTASIDDRIDEAYAVARQDGHLFLNASKWLAAWDQLASQPLVRTTAWTAAWVKGAYLYAGDRVSDGGGTPTYYVATAPFTTGAEAAPNDTLAGDVAAGKLTVLTGHDPKHILQQTTSNRNYFLGDNIHPNRARGYALYAASFWAMMREAAQKGRIQLGEHGVFRKL